MKNIVVVLTLIGLLSCSSSSNSTTDSAGTLVVQYTHDGKPLNCYKVSGFVDGSRNGYLYWEKNGGLMRVSPPYASLSVQTNGWESAASELGIDLAKCPGGRYRE